MHAVIMCIRYILYIHNCRFRYISHDYFKYGFSLSANKSGLGSFPSGYSSRFSWPVYQTNLPWIQSRYMILLSYKKCIWLLPMLSINPIKMEACSVFANACVESNEVFNCACCPQWRNDSTCWKCTDLRRLQGKINVTSWSLQIVWWWWWSRSHGTSAAAMMHSFLLVCVRLQACDFVNVILNLGRIEGIQK